MNMNHGDILDRLSIVLLKLAHAVADDKDAYKLECIDLLQGLYISTQYAYVLTNLLIVNAKIWNLEADIRNGTEMQLEEVGRRALGIREHNRERIRLKNLVNRFREVKINHYSEEK